MKRPPRINNWLQFNQSLLYPPVCLLCGGRGRREGAQDLDLCPGCIGDLLTNPTACRLCAAPLQGSRAGAVCGTCLRRAPPQDAAFAPYLYHYPLDWLIGRYKYHGQLGWGRTLGGLLARALDGRPLPEAVIPVPLHRRRLRERGYNQALELARVVAARHGLTLLPNGVRRRQATAQQAGLDATARRRNVRGAFAVDTRTLPHRVAVVDDVISTGSTVAELARVLRRAGVERVEVWALARAP